MVTTSMKWWCGNCGSENEHEHQCSRCTQLQDKYASLEYNMVTKRYHLQFKNGSLGLPPAYNDTWCCLTCKTNVPIHGPRCPHCNLTHNEQVKRAVKIASPWNMPDIFEPSRFTNRHRVKGTLQNTIPRQKDGGHTAFIVVRLNGRPTKILGFLRPDERVPPNGFEVSFELVASNVGNRSNSFVATNIRGESRFILKP